MFYSISLIISMQLLLQSFPNTKYLLKRALPFRENPKEKLKMQPNKFITKKINIIIIFWLLLFLSETFLHLGHIYIIINGIMISAAMAAIFYSPLILDRMKSLHNLNWLILMLMAIPIWAWIFYFARYPLPSILNGEVFKFIFSGELFTSSFDIRQAGMALDQPTIGKWLFLFNVAASISLPYAVIVGRLAERTTHTGYYTYAFFAFVTSFLLLSIIIWPACWLTQYIYHMGFTPRRIAGAIYVIAVFCIFIKYLKWSFTRPAGLLSETAKP